MKIKDGEDILLTIGIPVYNGEAYIEDAIKSIGDIHSYQSKIEILVSDNCSTDKTASIIKKYPYVKYFKNSENIGYDRNVNNVFEKSNGMFVWTLAADDILFSKEYLTDVLNLLKNDTETSLVHIGGSSVIEGQYEFYNDENFFIASNFQSGGVSTNIIKRDVWFQSDPSCFFGSGWIHFGVVMKIARSHKTLVTKRQLTGENPNTVHLIKTWDTGGSSLKVMLELIKVFNDVFDELKYSKAFQRTAKGIIKNSYPKSIVKAKAQGLKVELHLIKEFIKCYKEFPSFWLIDLPFLLLPRSICKMIYNQRNKLKEYNAD